MAAALSSGALGRLAGRSRPAAQWSAVARRCVHVVSEPTPNPDSVMFYPGKHQVLGKGMKTIKFNNKYDTADSQLAAAIFKVKGVNEVMLAARHVTVTKESRLSWDILQPNLELVISQFYAAGLTAVREGVVERAEPVDKPDPGSLEAQICELLEERVRPFVQQDGGDVEFHRFDHEDGTMYVRMHGACSGCPKSNVTLQVGIKNMMQHYIPEVKDVVPVEDSDEIPRPHA